jgi:hypothetical protein
MNCYWVIGERGEVGGKGGGVRGCHGPVPPPQPGSALSPYPSARPDFYTESWGRERIAQTLDAAVRLGISVVRT